VDRFLVAISEQEMAALYRQTDIFVSSSLEAEGFGLPAVEALSSGVPCVLTEIPAYGSFSAARDFAYFVPTHRPEAIADGIMTFINEGSIRNRCIERGLEVARAFSLERTKEHLAAFVEEIPLIP
jgi:glycosyltransferase involved in cell wall biosynthesis